MNKDSERLGALIKNFNDLHDLEYKVTFNLNENTFFQKLVAREVLAEVRIKPVDYLKSLVFLDYFSRTLYSDYSVCQNLETLSKSLREKEKAEGKDAGEEGPSYLSLETAVLEAGLWGKEKWIAGSKRGFSKADVATMAKRFKTEQVIDLRDAKSRKGEPFYSAIGEMVIAQVSDEFKPYLANANSRADVGAVIFTDSVMQYLKDSTQYKLISEEIANGKYFEASVDALQHLIKQSSIEKLQKAFGGTNGKK